MTRRLIPIPEKNIDSFLFVFVLLGLAAEKADKIKAALTTKTASSLEG